MRLHVTGRGLTVTEDLEDYVRRRAQFAMGRFAGTIASLNVRLSDVNGPRGGSDKCCDVRVEAEGLRKPVVVREQQDEIHAAVALAVDRAGRTVARLVRLAHSRSRSGARQRV